jgi:2-keto-4-pentenoate hydratase/2-oxohepta-3-ene-1,7-dioic acid hydratase in catechol pathway
MRWLTYRDRSGQSRAGIVVGAMAHGLEPGTSLRDVIDAGPDEWARFADRLQADPDDRSELGDVRIEAPFEPRSIRDSAGFIQHLRNVATSTGRVIDRRYTDFPPFYFANPGAVVGARDDVRMAPNTEQWDFELEIGAVIGREGWDVPVAEAEELIFGYTIFCDWSARDIQMGERDLFGPVKGKDSAKGLGPFVVTPDELEPFRSGRSFALRMRAYINEEPVSDGSWDTIDWGFGDMIAYASRGTRVRPADLMGSGTVPSGCLFEHYALDRDGFRGWLQPGDVVRLEVEQLGDIVSTVRPARPVQPLSSGYL